METFLQNCEVSELEVGVARDGDAAPPERRRLVQPYVLVGTDPRSDVRLDDKQVSRRHCYLQAQGGRVYVVDLGSRTGVHWPDGPQASGWVEWDQPLRIGGSLIRVSRPPPGARRTALVHRTEAPPAASAPEAVFETADGQRWRMRRPVALAGRSEGCKVRLRDERVSRFHCGLVRGPLGVWVVDLLTREGTRVSGQRVAWARLVDGDRLEIGPYALRVWFEQPAAGRELARVSSVVAVSRPVAAPAAPDQSVLLPVINEFNRMQQQMLDQFHQTMLMMAEMFTTLHREQAALVREELDEMRRLTQELNALQTERARHALMGPPAVQDASNRPQDAAPTARLTAAPNASDQPQDGARPAEPPKAAANGDKPPAVAPPDVHEWLDRRIAALQEERNGRWRKILQFITGGTSG